MSVKREMTRKPPCYGHSAAKNKNRAAVYPAESLYASSVLIKGHHSTWKERMFSCTSRTQWDTSRKSSHTLAASDGQTNSAGILRASPQNRSGEWDKTEEASAV